MNRWMDWLIPQVQSVGDFIFYRSILHYLRDEIQEFGIEMLGRTMQWVGGVALTLMTIWIMVQGYRIATGRSRDSMMLLVMNSLRATLVLTVATSMALFGSDLHDFLTGTVKEEINWVVTGEDDGPERAIDRNLAWMQVALTSIDALEVVSDGTLDDAKTRAMWFSGLGTGGPALVGGAMLLLYEVAMALFIGLGPLFVLSLLFDQTKALFSRWLYYGIGTFFSMAVLSAMVSIALEMVTRVAAAFWTSALLGRILERDFTDGITSQAMQQGGVGLILTVLIVSAPPMAAMFFQGTLGNFMAYSQVTGAHAAAQQAAASRPSGPSIPHGPTPAATRTEVDQSNSTSQGFYGHTQAGVTQAGMRGAARNTA